MEVRDVIHGVQVSAPFGNVKYALEVFEVLDDFAARKLALEWSRDVRTHVALFRSSVTLNCFAKRAGALTAPARSD